MFELVLIGGQPDIGSLARRIGDHVREIQRPTDDDCSGDALGVTMSSTGIARASDKVTFSPIAHKAALIRVLDSHAAKGSKVN